MASIDREAFERDGYVLLRGLLAPEDLAPVLRVILEAAGRLIDDLYEQGRLPSRFGDDPMVARWQHAVAALGGEHERRSWDADVVTPELHALMADPRVLDVVEPLVGGEIEATGMIAVRPKIPNDKRTTVLWHQDSNYFGEQTAAQRIISVWFPLVPADAHNGCMQVIPGSHRHGYHAAEIDTDHKALRPLDDPTRFGEPVTLPMQVGDVLFFSNLTYHRSLMNGSDHTRWSIDLRYHRAGMEHPRKPDFLPGFIARSRADPVAEEGWPEWRDQVARSPYFEKMRAMKRAASLAV